MTVHTTKNVTRKKYQSYKDSGIEWLGEIPEHWEVKRLKYTASINDEALSETTDPDYEFTYVDIGSVNAVDGITATEDYRFENAPSRARRIVRDGDTIVSTVRTYLRAITTIRKTDLRNSLIVSTGFAVVRPQSIVSRYLSCILTSSYFVETVVSRSTGVSYPAINASDVGNIEVIVPPLPEQRAIAAFLDRETARIDGLIEKKQRQIELLQEKRAALISHAVTKGVWGMMNDECGMMNKDEATHHSSLSTHHSSLSTPHFKDSGIEWLGEIPEHWEVKRLKYTASINDEALSETTDPDYEFTYVDIGSVNAVDGITATEDYRFENAPSRARRIVRDGDTIVSTVRTYLRAITTIRKTDLRNSLIVSTGFAVVRPRSIVSRYLSCILTSSYFVETVVSRSTGVSYPAINASDVGNIEVIVPPLPEQRAIAAFLDRETARIDGLIEKVEESIDLLREYRTALISAAVTGRIDVRVDKE